MEDHGPGAEFTINEQQWPRNEGGGEREDAAGCITRQNEREHKEQLSPGGSGAWYRKTQCPWWVGSRRMTSSHWIRRPVLSKWGHRVVDEEARAQVGVQWEEMKISTERGWEESALMGKDQQRKGGLLVAFDVGEQYRWEGFLEGTCHSKCSDCGPCVCGIRVEKCLSVPARPWNFLEPYNSISRAFL